MYNHKSSLLLTDLYQLTMLQSYIVNDMDDYAVFEFFSRKLPEQRNFLVCAGLQQVVDYLQNAHFTSKELTWLRQTKLFTNDFLDYLKQWRFTGQVYAMPEGTVCFANEPIIRIEAPLPEAQLIESRLINILQYQTLVASKAVRCKLAAPDKFLVDFGFRRAHGAEAGLMAARASYIAGFSGTATVLAGAEYNIPVFGTMAHSFIQAHDNEINAFRDFAFTYPENLILLIDTYDTEHGAQQVVTLAQELKQQGVNVKGVRLDSGDLAYHAVKVREILDDAGLTDVTIFSSGSIDEYKLYDLLEIKQAPIDGFGIGTKMDTSADAPFLDCAYKLQEYAGKAKRKLSEGKSTWPGAKQVYRYYDGNGKMKHDVITLSSDKQNGEALLSLVMANGKSLLETESLQTIRDRVAYQMDDLPSVLKSIHKGEPYEVLISDALRDLAKKVDQTIEASVN